MKKNTSSHMVLIGNQLGLALARAKKRADAYGQATKATSTQKAYTGDWARFCRWAKEAGESSAPPVDPEIVRGYLAYLADEGFDISTIERFLSATRFFHRKAEESWVKTELIAETMAGIRRQIGMDHNKKTPLRLDLLVQAIEAISGPMDRAMLSVGFFCSLRSANLVAIKRDHVSFPPEGLVLHLPQSKTDQEKKGYDVAVHRQEDERVCPVVLLRAHLASHDESEQLVFPVSRRYISRLVKRALANPEHGHTGIRGVEKCEECAERVTAFASHSLRRGFATTAAELGVSEGSIMKQGGWKTEKTMRGYIDQAALFKNNATKGMAKK